MNERGEQLPSDRTVGKMRVGSRQKARTASESIRALIRTGRYKRGDFLESEVSLSSTLGLSRGTVRKAINTLISTGELTRALHSRPRIGLPLESAGANGVLDVYVWVSHPISDRPSLMFMKGVSLGLKGTPYRMIVREPTRFYGTHVRSDERQFLQDLLDNSQVAGAIIQRDPFADTTDLIEQLQRQGKVLVFVDTLPPVEITADYVGSANLSAARQCVEYLIGLGHRNIVCLAESEAAETMRQRVLGFWRAMRQAGLENTATCLIAENLNRPMTRIYPAGRFTDRSAVHGGYAEWSQALVSKLLDLPERPTAAFVGCDVLAHSVAALLEGAGLRIPEDISILGFDWLARWNTDEPDDLTTAGQDFEGFGRHAVDLLLDRLASDTYRSARHILLPAPLVIRSSTGPVSTAEAADSNVGDSPSVAV